MATKKFDLSATAWTLVSNSAGLVELSKNCKLVFVHTGTSAPAIIEDAYHVLNASRARTFSYGGGHNIYARIGDGGTVAPVIVTGDDLP